MKKASDSPLFIASLSTKLDERSKYLRRLIITALEGGKRGHPGSSLSLVEILRVLYDDILKYQSNNPTWSERDRCILSKGHGCIALYAILVDKQFFPMEALKTFCHFKALLGGHPESKIPGVEASTGSLGHGLSIAVGMAMAAKIQKKLHRIFVVMGDGELNEGSVWEAALCAAKHRLDNLMIIIDRNHLQSYGTTEEVLNLEPLVDKWYSFGFSAREANGHDVSEIRHHLSQFAFEKNKPSVLICHTVKGKGIAMIENAAAWHHKASLTESDIHTFCQQLSES